MKLSELCSIATKVAACSLLFTSQPGRASDDPTQQAPSPSSDGQSVLGIDKPSNMEADEHLNRLKRELQTDIGVKYGTDTDFIDFGDPIVLPAVYGRGGMDFHDREIVVITNILNNGNARNLDWHLRTLAPRAGITEREIRELIYISCLYAGWPKCAQANAAFNHVLAGENAWTDDLRMKQEGADQ